MNLEDIFKTIVAGVVLWVVALEFRLRKAQTKLSASEQREKHEEISKKTRDLSDAELDALLSKNVGSGSD